MQQPNRRVALVIGAGSVKCAASLGLQRVLKREQIEVNLVVGCSGGSLYASLIALGYDVERVAALTRQLWTREVTERRSSRALLKILLPGVFGFDENFGLRDDRLILERLAAVYGAASIEDTQIPLFITATDFRSGEQVVLSEGSLRDAIRASIAIPFFFRPWAVRDRLLVDGAISDPLPVDVAIREGASVILAMGFESPLQTRIDSPVRYAFQLSSLLGNNLFRANFAFHNLAHHSEVIPVVPEFGERIRLFDVDKIPFIIEAGAQAMEAQLPYLRRLLAVVPG